MKGMLIDMDLRGKTVLIVGGGKVGERKAAKFLTAHANVLVASKEFTTRLKQLVDKIQLVTVDLEVTPQVIRKLVSRADFVIAATNQSALNRRIAEEARKKRTHVSVADNPQLGDFTMPVLSSVGAFQIAVSTSGKSPAMSRVLRKRIEEMISEEDILMLRLQSYARRLAKAQIPDQRSRKKALDEIREDRRIKRSLKKDNLQEAKELTKHIIASC
ncbi:MAG TPA: bifunctional precorrin-2 dehydrogenase/sirohydrochlorin ferrochelatase [archaeon]|nr:bifunctional precorrin-2 dehydrogenase/sirohydrochlorin ferrochelatase [archaeon]